MLSQLESAARSLDGADAWASLSHDGGDESPRRGGRGQSTRRERHNAVERRRQQQVSAAILRQRDFLLSRGVDVRKDKVSILFAMLKYLNSLPTDVGAGPGNFASSASGAPAGRLQQVATAASTVPVVAEDLDYVQVYRRHPLPTLICDVSGRCIDCNDAFIVAFRTTHTRVTRGQNVVHLGEGAGPKDAFMTMRAINLAIELAADLTHGPPGGSYPPAPQSVDLRRTLDVPDDVGAVSKADVLLRIFAVPASNREAAREPHGLEHQMQLVCVVLRPDSDHGGAPMATGMPAPPFPLSHLMPPQSGGSATSLMGPYGGMDPYHRLAMGGRGFLGGPGAGPASGLTASPFSAMLVPPASSTGGGLTAASLPMGGGGGGGGGRGGDDVRAPTVGVARGSSTSGSTGSRVGAGWGIARATVPGMAATTGVRRMHAIKVPSAATPADLPGPASASANTAASVEAATAAVEAAASLHALAREAASRSASSDAPVSAGSTDSARPAAAAGEGSEEEGEEEEPGAAKRGPAEQAGPRAGVKDAPATAEVEGYPAQASLSASSASTSTASAATSTTAAQVADAASVPAANGSAAAAAQAARKAYLQRAAGLAAALVAAEGGPSGSGAELGWHGGGAPVARPEPLRGPPGHAMAAQAAFLGGASQLDATGDVAEAISGLGVGPFRGPGGGGRGGGVMPFPPGLRGMGGADYSTAAAAVAASQFPYGGGYYHNMMSYWGHPPQALQHWGPLGAGVLRLAQGPASGQGGARGRAGAGTEGGSRS